MCSTLQRRVIKRQLVLHCGYTTPVVIIIQAFGINGSGCVLLITSGNKYEMAFLEE
jgi:hypothetical protein